ncbi:MAG: CocE/NonD family hydrolase [Hyphomicrobiaceae bacterium]
MDAANYSFRVLENEWIELGDGNRLAARIWLPDESYSTPVPAVLEYLPYRKRGGTDPRDDITYQHFARAGYAGIRVDIRGNGESDGLMTGEYTAQEWSDGKEVIAWIADQSWCDGNVGMIGHSWGGFNGLQIAALRPSALKAVVTSCSTDDRYADDIHFMGGCLNNDNTTWSQQMLAYSSRPPDPHIVGERWRDLWLHRLENMPFLAADWLKHQHRDAYWKHGSVCENYDAVVAPVLAVGGWNDCYSNAIPRLLAGLTCPAKGIIGPWEHRYPHMAKVTPGMDFLEECVRWWDHWLKGIDTGVDQAPALRVFLPKAVPASEKNGARQGIWIGEGKWPSETITLNSYHLTPKGLAGKPGPTEDVTIFSPLDTGLACGNFCPGMRVDDELPSDQRADDAKSVVFDTPALDHDQAILGAPEIELEISSDKPVALIAVRLCDIAPDGASTRVSHNPFNLTHRESHESPELLEPGTFYRIRFKLCDAGYIFQKGHKIRLALSSNYWPMVWPAPDTATLTIRLASCRLLLPVLPDTSQEISIPSPPPLPETTFEMMRVPHNTRRCETHAESGETWIEIQDDLGRLRDPDNGLETESLARHSYWVHPDDANSGRTEGAWTFEFERGDWKVRTETVTAMTSDAANFRLTASLRAFEGGKLVFEKDWTEKIKRDLV